MESGVPAPVQTGLDYCAHSPPLVDKMDSEPTVEQLMELDNVTLLQDDTDKGKGKLSLNSLYVTSTRLRNAIVVKIISAMLTSN